MIRNVRQNKILELITNNEIETQEELVELLKQQDFDITQATISRDIKQLGLIKVLTKDKKYKYAIVGNSDLTSDKILNTAKNCFISLTRINNTNVIKCVRGTVDLLVSVIEQMQLVEILGITTGVDTIMAISINEENAKFVENKLSILIK